ncbi:peptidoglycan-binding domain-containing protein [Roseobacter sp. MH60115]|uniref:peptidoglycan-binding domain-containing protein n=1 Tax=Roseobacter sp. MH60115 TaxID=2785324 RepID=UPI0018A2CF3D|nr:peptidoglycan-binding domain-containing protein [Roseobacter sp. MH60115]
MAFATDDTIADSTAVAVALRRECVVLSGSEASDRFTAHRALSEMLPLIGVLHVISKLDRALGHTAPFSAPQTYIERCALRDLGDNETVRNRLFHMLREDGLASVADHFEIETACGTLRIEAQFLLSVEGSHYTEVLFRILPNEETTKGILFGSLLSVLLSLATSFASGTISTSTVPPTEVVLQPSDQLEDVSDTLYICTFGGVVKLEDGGVIEEALRILSNPEDDVEAIQARQACLKALGLYDGEIDGVSGPITEAAQNALIQRYSLSHINWHDQNFSRFVLYRAAEAVNGSTAP